LGDLLENWVTVFTARHGKNVLSFSASRRSVNAAIHCTRIIQILDNLLANAMTFHDSDMPITLNVKRVRAQVQISLADEGPGLPAGKEERIFDRFYTERPASEGFGHHSGLGLSIARQIAIAHGGQLVAENDKNGGAVFTLTLPLADKP
ncbi:MAG: sensor histidine kinase, partial [Candidatus Puniceispirillaceae bacterium]